MIHTKDLSGRLALDARGLDALRLQAKQDPEQAAKAVSQQFEAVFLHTLLKSMRDATPQDGPLDSEQTRSYTSMLDQQMAQSLSTRGIGLADVMLRQLMRNRAVAPGAEPLAQPPGANTLAPAAAGAAAATSAPTAAGAAAATSALTATSALMGIPALVAARAAAAIFAPVATPASAESPAPVSRLGALKAEAVHRAQDFLGRMKEHALEASNASGIPARFLLGHAALESGWGKHEIRAADGSQSFNLFGIKAGGAWKGASVETMTTEYAGGVARRVLQKFRAYASYADAFQDYASLMKGNRRYAAVLKQSDSAGFAQGLQRAGYATDPQYADKLTRILNGARMRLTTIA